jgi:hypothetical protein
LTFVIWLFMASAPPMRPACSEKLPLGREHALVPVGMATILPEAARHVRHLESELLRYFYGYGYDEIILPTFEYLDVLMPGLEPTLVENSYKIIDRTTGRILLLRPDVTAQIARTVAMGMVGIRLPLRLSYRATVFRYEPEHAGRDREIFQVGAELIGADDASADCEMITMMLESRVFWYVPGSRQRVRNVQSKPPPEKTCHGSKKFLRKSARANVQPAGYWIHLSSVEQPRFFRKDENLPEVKNHSSKRWTDWQKSMRPSVRQDSSRLSCWT